MAQGDAIIQVCYGIDPESLSDDEWAKLIQQYKFVEQLKSVQFRNNMRIVLQEALNAVFGN